jgi:hypothetical protein
VGSWKGRHAEDAIFISTMRSIPINGTQLEIIGWGILVACLVTVSFLRYRMSEKLEAHENKWLDYMSSKEKNALYTRVFGRDRYFMWLRALELLGVVAGIIGALGYFFG